MSKLELYAYVIGGLFCFFFGFFTGDYCYWGRC